MTQGVSLRKICVTSSRLLPLIATCVIVRSGEEAGGWISLTVTWVSPGGSDGGGVVGVWAGVGAPGAAGACC